MPEPARMLRLTGGLVLGLIVASGTVRAAADGSASEEPKAYRSICRHCHESGVGPELRGRKLQPLYIDLFVRRGMRAMPAFPRSFVDDATLAQIAEFIQNSPAPATQPASAPATGGKR